MATTFSSAVQPCKNVLEETSKMMPYSGQCNYAWAITKNPFGKGLELSVVKMWV